MELSVADRWIRSRFGRTLAARRSEALAEYRFDFAATALYEFTWYDFCDWYLELAKPSCRPMAPRPPPGAPPARRSRRSSRRCCARCTRFMPFITEEIWQRVARLAGRSGDSIMLAPCPDAADYPPDEAAEREAAWIRAVILGVRQIRGEMDISPARRIPLLLQGASEQDAQYAARHRASLERLAGLAGLETLAAGAPAPPSASALVGTLTLLVPMAGLIDAPAEAERLGKLIGKAGRELESVRARLAQAGFVDHAPAAVVAAERARAADLEHTVSGLRAQLERVHKLLRAVNDVSAPDDSASLIRALALLETIILGKPGQIRLCLACLLARGHLLIEDVPGVGKTTLAHALAHVLGLAWQRVQFTSDLLPADIIGVSVFDRASQRFHFPQRPDLHAAAARRRGQPRQSEAPRARCSRPWRSGR